MEGDYWLFWTREADKAQSLDKSVALMVTERIEFRLETETDMDPAATY